MRLKFATIVASLACSALLLTACSSPTISTPTTPEKQEAPAESNVEPLPFNANGLLAGNATPSFEAGESGAVSVVHIGALLVEQGTLLFAFRNNTSEAISHVDWAASASSGGTVVGSGSSQGTTPSVVQPGEVGLSYIYFDSAGSFPDGTEYEFQVETSAADTTSYNTAALRVTEANLVGDAIVGSATNETGASTVGPFSASVYCFDGDNLVDTIPGFADQDGPIEDKNSVTFSEMLYGKSCPTFIVGVSGWFE